MIAEEWLTARRGRLLAGQRRRRRHRALYATRRARPSSPAAHPAPADGKPRRQRANVALADFVAPRRPASPTRSAASPSPPATASGRCAALQGRRRRLFGDPGHAARRPPGRGLRRGPAPEGAHRALGLCAGRDAHQRQLIAEATAASARRPAIRPSPTTPRRRTLFACWTPRRATGMKLTESFAMTPPPRSPASTSPTPRPLLRRRQDRARPGRGLRPPQGLGP